MSEKNSISFLDFWKFLASGNYSAVYDASNQMTGKIVNALNEVIYQFKYNSNGLYQLVVV